MFAHQLGIEHENIKECCYSRNNAVLAGSMYKVALYTTWTKIIGYLLYRGE